MKTTRKLTFWFIAAVIALILLYGFKVIKF
jgi:hypothetical protein